MNVPHAVFLLACVATVSSASADPGNLISLDDGIKPLVTRFNNHQDRAQIVAILSPT